MFVDVVFFNDVSIRFTLLKKKIFVKNNNKNVAKILVVKCILNTAKKRDNMFAFYGIRIE